ncbi:MAG TPA: hypothetical protein VN666_16505 [Nitrospira sp.]|nr:hypothetical protein [Nitrospira sp.]
MAWVKHSQQDLYVELTPGPAMHGAIRFSYHIGLPSVATNRVYFTMVGLLITEKSAETKHGHAMEFITLEDVTALYDAMLFPEVYRRCCHLLSPNRPYVVRGLLEEAFGVVTLTVLDLRLLESMVDKGNHPLPLWQEPVYGESCDTQSDQQPNSFSFN